MNNNIPLYKSSFGSSNLEILLLGKIKFFTKVANSEKTSSLVRVKLGKRNLVIAKTAEAVKYFLVDNYKNYEKRTNLTIAFGRNIFTSSGDEWVSFRRPLMPIFSKKVFESNFDEMKKIISCFYESEFSIDDLKKMDAVYFFSKLVFKLNTNILIGNDFSSHFEIFNKDLLYLNKYFNELNYRFIKSGFLNKLLYKKADLEFDSAILRINNLVKSAAFNHTPARENSVLERLLKVYHSESNKMSEEDLINQVKMLIFAGYETTSLTMSWLTYFLCENPIYQDKIFDELINLPIDSIHDLDRALVTKNVLYETLRLRPIGWALTRYAVKDDEYEGMKIHSDDCLFTSPYLIHHSERYYENPEVFDPSRFERISVEELGTKYLAFGAGPRVCIGEDLAMIQLILSVRSLVLNFKLVNLSGNIESNPQTTLMLKNPLYVSFIKR
jgi:cytochrome P450